MRTKQIQLSLSPSEFETLRKALHTLSAYEGEWDTAGITTIMERMDIISLRLEAARKLLRFTEEAT